MKKCRTVRFMWVCTLLLVVLMCGGCGEADRAFIGNEYVQLEMLEGLSYALQTGEAEDGTHRYGVAIYNGDFLCGFFGVRDFPEDGMQQTNAWELFCAGLSSHGAVEVAAHEVSDSIERYDLLITDMPFSYADTEWLVDAGVFQSVTEACAEERKSRMVLWGQSSVDKGYYLSLNPLFISGKQMDALVKSVSFSDRAFAIDEVEAWLYIAGLEPAKSEEYKDIFIPENAERLSYCLNVQGKEMRLPAQTVALQLDEKSWEIYGYTSSGTVKIGEIYAADDWNINIEEGVVWTQQ